MKTKLFPALAGLCGLGFALLLIPSLVKPAQAQPQRNPAVVILTGQQDWIPGQPFGHYGGFSVENATSSRNAPTFQSGDNLAEALLLLREQGFQITVHDSWLTYTAIR